MSCVEESGGGDGRSVERSLGRRLGTGSEAGGAGREVDERALVRDVLGLYRAAATDLQPNGHGGLARNGLGLSPATEAGLAAALRAGQAYAVTLRLVAETNVHGGRVARCLKYAVDSRIRIYVQALGPLASRPDLSLQRVAATMDQPTRTLLILHSLLRQARDKTAPAILSLLHQMSGVPQRGELVLPIFEECLGLWREECVRWMVQGRVEDPLGEFFVIGGDETAERGWWVSRYALAPANVPSFLSSDAARSILIIGKSVAFRQSVCREEAPKDGPPPGKFLASEALSLLHDPRRQPELERKLEASVRLANQDLIRALLEKGRLVEHLAAIRDLVLLQRGDFAEHLQEGMWDELEAPSELLSQNSLFRRFQETVLTGGLEDLGPLVEKAYSAEVVLAGSQRGWDALLPKYQLAEHLLSVVDKVAMDGLLRLWRQEWELRRIKARLGRLSVALRRLSSIALRLGLQELLSGPVRLALAVLRRSRHFLLIFSSYTSQEAIASSFNRLPRRLEAAKDLDELHLVVSDFVEEACRKAFRDRETEDLGDLVDGLLRKVGRVGESVEDLVATLRSWEERLSGAGEEEDHASRAQRARDRAAVLAATRGLVPELRSEWTELGEAEMALQLALNAQPHLALRDLAQRLNFSHTLSSQRLDYLNTTESPAILAAERFGFPSPGRL